MFFFLFCYFYNLCIIYLFFALTAVLDVRCYLFENKFVFTNVSSIINYWADSCSSIIDSECTDYQRNNQTAGRNLEPTYYASHLCTIVSHCHSSKFQSLCLAKSPSEMLKKFAIIYIYIQKTQIRFFPFFLFCATLFLSSLINALDIKQVIH